MSRGQNEEVEELMEVRKTSKEQMNHVHMFPCMTFLEEKKRVRMRSSRLIPMDINPHGIEECFDSSHAAYDTDCAGRC